MDPKKPNPPETSELAERCSGRCWLDLRGFIPTGAKRVELDCVLEPDDKALYIVMMSTLIVIVIMIIFMIMIILNY